MLQLRVMKLQLCTDQSTVEPSASIRASISKGTCDWSCRCQCHPRKGVESPRWLTDLLGTLFYSHTGATFLRLRPCNYPSCIQRESASWQLTYHFPQWMMKKAFMLTVSLLLVVSILSCEHAENVVLVLSTTGVAAEC